MNATFHSKPNVRIKHPAICSTCCAPVPMAWKTQVQHPLFSEMCAGAVPFVFSTTSRVAQCPWWNLAKCKGNCEQRRNRTQLPQDWPTQNGVALCVFGILARLAFLNFCARALHMKVAHLFAKLVCLFACVLLLVGWMVGCTPTRKTEWRLQRAKPHSRQQQGRKWLSSLLWFEGREMAHLQQRSVASASASCPVWCGRRVSAQWTDD